MSKISHINSGDLRHRVRLERQEPPDPNANSFDRRPGDWDSLGTYWAHVKPENSQQTESAGQLLSTTTYTITTRRNVPVKPKDRFVWRVKRAGIFADAIIIINSLYETEDHYLVIAGTEVFT